MGTLLVAGCVAGSSGGPSAPSDAASPAEVAAPGDVLGDVESDTVDADVEPVDTRGDDSSLTDTAQPDTGWLAVIPDATALAALSVDGGPVKYLSVVSGADPPAPIDGGCLFQDMHRWEYHIEFLRSFPELAGLPYDDYLAMVLRRPTRVFWGGAVEDVPQVKHPRTGQTGIVTYVVYSEAGAGSLRVEDLVEVDAQLEACLPYAADRLVFVPSDLFQRQLVVGAAAALAAGDVDVISPESLPP